MSKLSRDALMRLIPKYKGDVEGAEALVQLGFPTVEPVLPELLGCIQDPNYPIVEVLLPFLESLGAPLAPCIRDVINGPDESVKYWILMGVVRHSPELIECLRPELLRICREPTSEEIKSDLPSRMKECLDCDIGQPTGLDAPS